MTKNKQVIIRIAEEDHKKIQQIIKKQHYYGTLSNFVRCATLKLLEQEQKNEIKPYL